MAEQKKTNKYRPHTYFQNGKDSTQFACFQCRKIFKRRVPFPQGRAEKQYCTQCGSEMWFTGHAFKAPRKEDIKQWHKAELLIKNGVLFHPNSGARPEVLREIAPFLKRRYIQMDKTLLTTKQIKKIKRQSSES